ncbi:MAG: glycosyltransferase family 4 protein [Candidatus Nealsonbacteria bacterium]|nr:glycosyltransferase family 4 protein [Candidatus Nealsonbacteria bacterium]
MKLLIIVQRVDFNDDNLSFFHRILEKFSEKLEKVFVVGLQVGEHHLPENVEVFSLGKEKGYSKIRQFFRMQKILFKCLPESDGVYCHMGSIFAIAAFPLAKLFGKKLVLWYAHGALPWKLKLAEKLVNVIVTSSSAGCRLKSKKIEVVGQAIDTEFFKPIKEVRPPEEVKPRVIKILYAARLVPVKDHKTLIEAVNILVNQKNINNLKARILGRPLLKSQEEYLADLKNLVKNYNLESHIEFAGGVSFSEMPEYFNWADLFVNPSSTGSLDKVVLEAMSSGCLVLTCNEAYREILAQKYMFKKGDEKDLAQKMLNLMGAAEDPALREIVVKNHNLNNFIDKIIFEFK